MNKKGIFLTFIVFLLVLTILLFSFSEQETQSLENQRIIEQAAFDAVNRRFESINNELLVVKTGYAGRQQSRIMMPFDYSGGNMQCADNSELCPCNKTTAGECGWVQITQDVPSVNTDDVFSEIFDALNLYEIFVSDANQSGDLNITTDAAKNEAWKPGCTASGTCDNFDYIIVPQCVRYKPTQTSPGLELFVYGITADNCTFDPSSVIRADANISIHKLADENTTKIKRIWGNGDLSNTSLIEFSLGNPGPYLRINLNIENCKEQASCADDECCGRNLDGTVSGKRTIANHLQIDAFTKIPSQDNQVELKGETGSSVYFYLLNKNELTNNKNIFSIMDSSSATSWRDLKMQVITRLIFNAPISTIRSKVFDFNVSMPNFSGLVRST